MTIRIRGGKALCVFRNDAKTYSNNKNNLQYMPKKRSKIIIASKEEQIVYSGQSKL